MSSSPHPMVGKLLRLPEDVNLRNSVVSEGTVLLVVDIIRVGKKGAIDYLTLLNGITERIPDYWRGWRLAHEVG